MSHKASYWSYENDKIRCELCPHNCLIQNGNKGLCQTRKNIDNELIVLNYEKLTSIALDSIEKKPLYHYYPGRKILSIASFGCNMKCQFCQNYEISQYEPKTENISSNRLLKLVDSLPDNIGVAFTYNEPLMWYEYILDSAKLIKKKLPDKKIVLVTNGFINEEPLKELLPFIDALNIDLKSFNNNFYQKLCKVSLEPVLNSIKLAAESTHVEVTTLLVTSENDSLEEVANIAKFLASISADIPLHLSRYFPNYKLNNPPTNINFMKQAKLVAKEYLNYVYLGNIPNEDINTYCPSCGELVINRTNNIVNLDNKKCLKCGNLMPIINNET